jgi:hypothetical protein
MRTGLTKDLVVLEKAREAERNEQGRTVAEAFRERVCRIDAEQTGRPFEELVRESRERPRTFWANTGDRSIAGVWRSRFRA